jgi:flagellar hook-associated protein FlgK
MRRLLAITLIASLTLGLGLSPANAVVKAGAGCKKLGAKSTASGKTYTCIKKGNKLIWNNGVKSKSSDAGVSVDKNLLSVVITIPASFYEGTKITQESLNADAAKNGTGKATLNSDGSVTWRMSRAEHAKVMADMKKSVDDYIQEAVDESPTVFREITYDKNMTEFKILVNQAKFEEDFSAGMIGFGIGILASFFQMFNNGVKDPKIVMRLIDADTGRVFETQNFPPKD